MHRYLKLLPALLLPALTACGGGPAPEFYEKQQVLMGTVFKIRVPSASVSDRREFSMLADAALMRVSQLESKLSEWRDDSPISEAAAQAGVRPVLITPDVADVVGLALRVSDETGGAFDITFKPLGKLWNVKESTQPPPPAEVAKARVLVDYRAVKLDRAKMTLFLKKRGMAVGLGGVAKGYAAGEAGKVFESYGIKNFIVDAGGDLYYSGSAGDRPWTGGLRDPDGGLVLRFRVKRDCAVVTSGDYESFFVHGGKRYHHIIDPATGYPAEGPTSVTVFSSDPAAADAYATAFFVMGREKALKSAAVREGRAAFIMLEADGTVFFSPGVEEYADIR